LIKQTTERHRHRLIEEARKLLDIPFPKTELGQQSGMLELGDPPATLSCSQFIRCVVDRAFGSGFWMKLVNGNVASVVDGGARAMSFALARTQRPLVGDLRFFGDDGSDDWHVMLVASGSTLIGACPGDAVREVPLAYFSGMKDQQARQMPLPADGAADWP
jgi:hypothetical protein